jgi:hypothetical protein
VTEVTRHSAGTVPTHHAQAVKKRTYPGIGGNLAHALGAAQGDADSVSGQNGIFTDHRHSFGIDCRWKAWTRSAPTPCHNLVRYASAQRGGLPASINCKLSGIVRPRRGWIVVTHCGTAWADRSRPV